MTAGKKKMNTYLKMGLIMAGCVLAGAAVGLGLVFADLDGIGGGMNAVLQLIRRGIFPIMLVLLLCMAVVGEWVLKRLNRLGDRLPQADDEEGDLLEYEMEKVSAVGTVGSTVFSAAATLVLSTGYSLRYIEDTRENEGIFLLAAMVIYMVIMFYEAYWSVRYIKCIQKIQPEKYGDPASLKFQQEWLESCDEAEREAIYQASYRSYMVTSKFAALLLLISMLCHLIWNTGIMAVFMVCLMQLVMTVTYCRACIKKKGTKLNI